MKIKILVAAHKVYHMPIDDIYLPIQVGKELSKADLGFTADDTGNNISAKNPNYCELTAVYWAWKNLNADYIGAVHYRRHFVGGKGSDIWSNIMSREQAEKLLAKADIILPKKRNYYIESTYSHYINSHMAEGLDNAIAIIKKAYPEYALSCDKVMKRSWAHMFNMFVMKKDKFDAYCEWLFSILFEVEKQIDLTSYFAFEARVFGRISELLLDVWIEKNDYAYVEVPVKFMEKQNWIHKGGMFILRKMKLVKVNEKY